MYRSSLSRASCRCLTNHCYKSKSHESNNASQRMGFSQPFTKFKDHLISQSSRQSFVRPLQAQIVNALHLGQRDRAFELLSDLSHGNYSLQADDFVYVLDYCAKSPDPLFVMETWRVMEEKAIALNRRSCMFIIRALSKGGYLGEALKWLTYHERNPCANPVLSMYNIFVNECAKTQSLTLADCLKLTKDRLTGKSEITYWELLKFAVMEQNLFAVQQIWKDCTMHYSPSIISLRKFICSFARLGDLRSAFGALQRMVALAFDGSSPVGVSAVGRFQSLRLDIPIPSNVEFYNNVHGINKAGISSYSFVDDRPTRIEENQKLNGIQDAQSILLNPATLPKATECFFTETTENRHAVHVDNCGEKSHLHPIPVVHVFESGRQCLVAKVEVDNMGSLKLEGQGCHPLKDVASVPIMKLLRWSFNDVIHACAQSRDSDLAEKLFIQMQNIGLEPSQHTFDGFVKAVISERGVVYGMKVVKAMEKRNLKPYATTLAALSVGYSKILELDIAEALLDQVANSPQKYIHPFNALLAACDVMDQPQRAVRVLTKMKKVEIKSDIRTYELLFSLFGNVNVPYEKGNKESMDEVAKRISVIEMDMARNGVQHSRISMENLLKALGAEGMIRELIQYLRVAENHFGHSSVHPVTAMYNTVLHALIEAKEIQTATELFRNMRLCGLPPDAATYNIMIDSCSIMKCYQSACSLVSMMLRDGFSPDTYTFTALIKIVLANEDFNKAMHLMEQASADAVPDVLLYNTVLLEAYLKGRIDIIELIIERMHEDEIQPDPTTCSYVFSAYVDCGFLTTALEALQVLSLRMISNDKTSLEDMRSEFEDLVHNEEPDSELRIIELFREADHLAAGLLNLRWSAIAGCSISWSPSESLWSKRLSSSYGSKKRNKLRHC